eukprot:COSAG01_NODE_25776_length_733_cov_1.457413_1_plen_143_part_10
MSKLEHGRVVSQVTRAGHLPLIKPYLLQVRPMSRQISPVPRNVSDRILSWWFHAWRHVQVQTFNVTMVNDALNGLLMEEEAWEELRESIDNYDNFDQIGLATQLFKNECLEFRRISSYLYKKNGRYEESIQLSKQDKLCVATR